GNTAQQTELKRQVQDRLEVPPELFSTRIEESEQASMSADRRKSSEHSAGSDTPSRALTTKRERRERALLAMCIASPADGAAFLGKLTPEHLSSPLANRAVQWLKQHLEEPMAGLPRDEEDLVSLITQLVATAGREPASRDAMELNFLQLEQAMVEDEIVAAQRNGGDPPVALQRRRAELGERIAHWEKAQDS
ncbi:MAG: hypothetical protein ACRDQW_16660, partial [Haloechinothrix sp.]